MYFFFKFTTSSESSHFSMTVCYCGRTVCNTWR